MKLIKQVKVSSNSALSTTSRTSDHVCSAHVLHRSYDEREFSSTPFLKRDHSTIAVLISFCSTRNQWRFIRVGPFQECPTIIHFERPSQEHHSAGESKDKATPLKYCYLVRS